MENLNFTNFSEKYWFDETELASVPRLRALTNSRVLVVEDDVTQEPIWEHIITRVEPKAHIFWASSAEEAAALIREGQLIGEPFDLVVSDIYLSDSRTGIDLWEQFHEQLDNKMILVSGISPEKVWKWTTKSGFAPRYLKKPLKANECIEAVYYLLKKE